MSSQAKLSSFIAIFVSIAISLGIVSAVCSKTEAWGVIGDGTYVTSDGWEFYFLEGVSGYTADIYRKSSIEDVLVVPSTLVYNSKTYTVTQMQDSFSQGLTCSSLTLPSTMKYIYRSQFEKNSKLKTVVLVGDPEAGTPEKFETKVFSGCSNLESVTLPSTLTAIPQETFLNCERLSSIDIPSGVTEIGPSAFSGCSSLKEITIPSGVTTIGANAFNGCSKLETIVLNGPVSSIDSSAFTGCTQLKEIRYVGDPAQKEQALGAISSFLPADAVLHELTFVPANPATCLDGSKAYYSCTCGKNYEDSNFQTDITGNINDWKRIPGTGHTPVAVPAVAATCSKTGLSEGSKCKVCNAVITPQKVVSKKAHVAVAIPAVSAQIGVPGKTEGSVCQVCKETIKKQEETPALLPSPTGIAKLSKSKRGFTAKWTTTTPDNADGYQVRYSLKASMAKAKVRTVGGAAKGKLKVSKLKPKKRYYIQVRVYKTVNGQPWYSEWSAKKKVRTK